MTHNQIDQKLTIDELTKFFQGIYAENSNHLKCLYYPLLQFVAKSGGKVSRDAIKNYFMNKYNLKFGKGTDTFALDKQLSHRFRTEPILNKIFTHNGGVKGEHKTEYGLNVINSNLIMEYLTKSPIDESKVKSLMLFHQKVLEERSNLGFFTEKHIDTFRKYAGEVWNKNLLDHNEAQKVIKDAHSLVKLWANEVHDEVFPDGPLPSKKINALDQATPKKFRAYLPQTLQPSEFSPEALCYWFFLDARGATPCFKVSLGFVDSLSDTFKGNYPDFNSKRKVLENEYGGGDKFEEQFHAQLPASDGLLLGVEGLSEWAIQKINEFPLTYEAICEKLGFTKQQKSNPEGGVEVKVIPLNQILYGPPGTGKTYNTINKAVAIANPEFDLVDTPRYKIKAEFDRLIETGQIVFTTFHQSMSYEDFIEGIKPETDQDGNVVYEVKPGIFKKLCDDALTPNHVDFNAAYEKLQKDLSEGEVITLKTPKGREFSISLNSNSNLSLHTGLGKNKSGTLTKENIQRQINGENVFIGWEGYFKGVLNHLETKCQYTHKQNEAKNFVLIIDEINRGNVSQIFGELITLIEDDKRLGKDEELKVTLPYSQNKFGVPSNVYIIGTMNTADRSVEALDAALRRRFSFEEMQPRPDLIATKGKSEQQNGYVIFKDSVTEIHLPKLLENINKRIEQLLDKDHQIGHSYFMSVSNVLDLRETFQNKIIPLLQEYFFGDYGKLGLVLGEPFFEEEESKKVTFANFRSYDESDFADRAVYKLKNLLEKNDSGFVLSDDAFVEAIKSLLE